VIRAKEGQGGVLAAHSVTNDVVGLTPDSPFLTTLLHEWAER